MRVRQLPHPGFPEAEQVDSTLGQIVLVDVPASPGERRLPVLDRVEDEGSGDGAEARIDAGVDDRRVVGEVLRPVHELFDSGRGLTGRQPFVGEDLHGDPAVGLLVEVLGELLRREVPRRGRPGRHRHLPPVALLAVVGGAEVRSAPCQQQGAHHQYGGPDEHGPRRPYSRHHCLLDFRYVTVVGFGGVRPSPRRPPPSASSFRHPRVMGQSPIHGDERGVDIGRFA